MSQQPEALRLAKALKVYNAGVYSQALAEEYDKASAMLRNQHAEIDRLRAELEALRNQEPVAWCATDESGEKVEALGFNESRRRFDTPLYFAAGAQPVQSKWEVKIGEKLLPSAQPEPLQEMLNWPKGATHYQPQQKAFYKRVSACEWYVWSRITDEPLHWSYSPGTMDSAEWIVRAQPAPSVPGRATMIERLKAAVEGECDGLAIDDRHAEAILDYVLAAAPEAPKLKPLTVDGLLDLFHERQGEWWKIDFGYFSTVARAVEAAHGIKE